MNNLELLGIPIFKKGSGIHIKKENRGKFTKYCNGKVTQECIDKAKRSGNKKLIKRATFVQNSRKWAKKHQKGNVIQHSSDESVPKYNRALYSSINPIYAYPDPILAFITANKAYTKVLKGEQDEMEYAIGNSLGEQVADAAWRKRLGLSYDDKLLPVFSGDTVRLPKQIENEIPVDTTFLKKRIAANKALMDKYAKYKRNPYIRFALSVDEKTLEALRKTYATGEPVGINEFSHNTRQWVNNGEITEYPITPLNVLQNFNIRYDKPTNRMYYSDEYDFNEYELGVPGIPFRFRGYIDLNKK